MTRSYCDAYDVQNPFIDSEALVEEDEDGDELVLEEEGISLRPLESWTK